MKRIRFASGLPPVPVRGDPEPPLFFSQERRVVWWVSHQRGAGLAPFAKRISTLRSSLMRILLAPRVRRTGADEAFEALSRLVFGRQISGAREGFSPRLRGEQSLQLKRLLDPERVQLVASLGNVECA